MFNTILNLFSEKKNSDKKATPHEKKMDFNRKCNALQGDLSVVTIENLMQLMSYSGLSGELRLVVPDNAACFVVDNGTLVFAYLQTNSLKIGERLEKKGYISAEGMKECLRVYRNQATQSKFGTLLVEKGYLNRNNLVETIKEQVRDIFFEALSWKNGTFSFSACDTSDQDIPLEERIDHLILTGIVQLENRAQNS